MKFIDLQIVLYKILKFVLKNWIRLFIGIGFIILMIVLISFIRSCDDAGFKEDIEALDKEISELKKENVKFEDEAKEYITSAEADAKKVEDLKAVIADTKSEIEELKKEEFKIYKSVMALPPSLLVEDTRKILECAEVELTDNGILLSEVCARLNLVKLKGFSLIRAQLGKTEFALSTAEKALNFSDRRSWKLYGALWKYGDVIINLKSMGKKKDQKYERSEKQRRRSYFRGIVLGLVIGAGITITIVIIIPLIRWLF